MQLELKGITKRFPGVVANEGVDLTVAPGEIHALLGENGAGKTTLMNVLYGLYRPDEGEILIDGTPVPFRGPGDAIAAGIGMVHQHFMLVPVFTVTENIMLGVESTSGPLLALDRGAARRRIVELSRAARPAGRPGRRRRGPARRRAPARRDHQDPLPPARTCSSSTSRRRCSRRRRPTSSSRSCARWREAGTSIIFITHKLNEVLADRRPDHRAAPRARSSAPRPRRRPTRRSWPDDGRPPRRSWR